MKAPWCAWHKGYPAHSAHLHDTQPTGSGKSAMSLGAATPPHTGLVARLMGCHPPPWHRRVDPLSYYEGKATLLLQLLEQGQSPVSSVCPPTSMSRRGFPVAVPCDLNFLNILDPALPGAEFCQGFVQRMSIRELVLNGILTARDVAGSDFP